ncbi:MAG: sigma 54-interacting transcriptional regulator [Deltaproteobacteria bacterium]|jgi:two-component system NtrC family response regulator|nr:sigma 54-interacting transcriptional regulator [Deltaproteobacteria bacterium]
MSQAETILIVDDEPNYLLVIGELLEAEGYDIMQAQSGRLAFDLFQEHGQVDLVLTDMTMPDGGGIELLVKVKEHSPEVPVILLTAHGTIERAVEAMKEGAFDYLTKPCRNSEILRAVAKALEVSRLSRQNKELRAALADRFSFGKLIGKSKPMLELYRYLEKVAPTRANVLITGESGTGKELVAQAIHYNSPRSGHSFVAVNCSALSDSLLESELFGYEKGAFTGAGATRAGRFEMAHEGTIFLDEIGEMGPSAQVKLLRVLQERSIERVGGGTPIKVDVRVVAATNRDLRQEVALGRFREDLFYRLNVVHLRLPTLRERLDDLPLLIEHFLEKHKQGPDKVALNPETKRLLYAHLWPGNIRELENVIERGLVLARDQEIMPEDLPEELRRTEPAAEVNRERNIEPAAGGSAFGTARTGLSEINDPGGSFSGRPEAVPPASQAWTLKAMAALPPDLSLTDTLGALQEGLVRKAMASGDGVQSRAAEILGLKRNVFKFKWDKYVGAEPAPLSEVLAEIAPEGLDLVTALEELEKQMLRQAMAQSQGVMSRAADLLGLKKNLMAHKLKKYPNLN